MRILGLVSVVGLSLLAAACGTNETQRAATGGLTGLGVGALAGGPVGAVVGGVVGAGTGSLMPEGADQLANNAINKEHGAARTALNNSGLNNSGLNGRAAASGSSIPPSHATSDTVRQAQQALKQQGFYHGRVDGIDGPKTRQALTAFQEKNGLPQTAQLDDQTAQKLDLAPPAGMMSGSSMPPSGQVMSPDQVQAKLSADGYQNVSDVRHWGDQDYTARAEQDGHDYTVMVDGQSGQIIDKQ